MVLAELIKVSIKAGLIIPATKTAV